MVMTEDRLSSFYDRQGEENSFFLVKKCYRVHAVTYRYSQTDLSLHLIDQ